MLARGADHGLLKIHEQNLTVNVAVAGDGIKNAECFTIHWMSLLFLSYENWIVELRSGTKLSPLKKTRVTLGTAPRRDPSNDCPIWTIKACSGRPLQRGLHE